MSQYSSDFNSLTSDYSDYDTQFSSQFTFGMNSQVDMAQPIRHIDYPLRFDSLMFPPPPNIFELDEDVEGS